MAAQQRSTASNGSAPVYKFLDPLQHLQPHLALEQAAQLQVLLVLLHLRALLPHQNVVHPHAPACASRTCDPQLGIDGGSS